MYLHVGIEPEDIADGKVCPISLIPRVFVPTDISSASPSDVVNGSSADDQLVITSQKETEFNFAVQYLESLRATDLQVPRQLVSELISGSALDSQQLLQSSRDSMVRFLRTREYRVTARGNVATLDYKGIDAETLRKSCLLIVDKEVSNLEKNPDWKPTLFSPVGLDLCDVLAAAGYRMEDRGKPAASCSRAPKPYSYDERFKLATFIKRSENPGSVLKLIPKFPSDFIEKHATWTQTSDSDPLRLHKLGMYKAFNMFNEYGQIAHELKVAQLPVDANIDDVSPSGSDVEDRVLLAFETKVPPTMKTSEVYTTKVIVLAEPSENRRIPLDALKIVVCECTCKAGRSRKCPHCLALLFLLDNYHNVSEFGTGRAKDQTWWKPKLNDSHRLNIPLSHLPFPNRQDQVGPSLLDAPQSKRLRRSDRVRAEGTNGRYQPDKFGAIVEKFTDPALLNPIETNAEGFQQYFAALPKPTSDADLLSESESDS